MNISGNKEGIVRKEAMEKKNRKQEEYAIKAMKMCGKAAVDSGIGIGTLVSLKVDYQTHCHAQGLLAIVYRFLKIQVVSWFVVSMELSHMTGQLRITGSHTTSTE